ncbi:MAG: hypothetical protein AB7T63_09300 [Planctomycetota bacterium]
MPGPVLPAELDALRALEAWPAELDAAVAAAEGWSDAEDVRAACRRNRIRDLLGGDERAQRALARALETVPTERPTRALAAARRVASRVLDHLQQEPHAVRLALTGALRRMAPRVASIDLLATSDDAVALRSALAAARFVRTSVQQGDTLHARLVDGAAVTLRVLPEDATAFVLAHMEGTGPAELVAQLHDRAHARGVRWDELLLETEADFFAALDMAPVPPERREAVARGEPVGLPVEAADVRGLAALHSAYGAGRFPLATWADTATAQGFAWLLVADRAVGPGPHVDVEALARLRTEVASWRRLRSEDDDLEGARVPAEVLLGVRVALDAAPAWPAADLVIGVPDAAGWPETARGALASGAVDVLAAPPRTSPRCEDLEAWRGLVEAARGAHAALALGGEASSATPPPGLGALLIEAGVPVLLDADETLPGELDQLLAALAQARREAVPAPLVMNAWSAARVRSWASARRERRS